MKTLDIFVVELEKQIDDTIKTEGGLELYVDARFNEFKHRITEGPVVSAPMKYNTGVEEGDTLYFHHLVVLNEGQVLTGDDNHYIVQFDPNQTINNQAIAYKSAKSGHIHPLAGWSLMEPIEEEKEKPSEALEVVSFSETPVKKARVAFDAPWISELGVKTGDVVGLPKNRDYEITIEGKKYFRVRTEDFLYVEEEVHND